MTLREQIDCWFQAGEHERTVQAILKLPGSECTDELMGELAVAYNNLGEYKKAILVLEELKNRVCFTASWQYRMGYEGSNPGEDRISAPESPPCILGGAAAESQGTHKRGLSGISSLDL